MTDDEYLARRAEQEREAAEQASSEAARIAHLKLAEEYERQMGGSGAASET